MEGELVSPPGQATVSGVGVLSMKQGPVCTVTLLSRSVLNLPVLCNEL